MVIHLGGNAPSPSALRRLSATEFGARAQHRRQRPDAATLKRIDVYLRFGDTPAPVGHPELALDVQFLGWEARPDQAKRGDGRSGRRAHGNALPVTLADVPSGKVKGRTSANQITYSARGNLQGAQFFAVAGRVYEQAKQAGREIPTEWFLQDIRN